MVSAKVSEKRWHQNSFAKFVNEVGRFVCVLYLGILNVRPIEVLLYIHIYIIVLFASWLFLVVPMSSSKQIVGKLVSYSRAWMLTGGHFTHEPRAVAMRL